MAKKMIMTKEAREKRAELNLTTVRHFRLTPADAALWDKKVLASGMTSSAFFRRAVIENRTKVIAPPKKPLLPAHREILFLLGKQGNNINQIALALNAAQLAGGITSKECLSVLYELKDLNEKSDLILREIL